MASLLGSPDASAVGLEKREKSALRLRKAEDRERFGDFGRNDIDRATEISAQSGYYLNETTMRTKEHARAFSVASLREKRPGRVLRNVQDW